MGTVELATFDEWKKMFHTGGNRPVRRVPPLWKSCSMSFVINIVPPQRTASLACRPVLKIAMSCTWNSISSNLSQVIVDNY